MDWIVAGVKSRRNVGHTALKERGPLTAVISAIGALGATSGVRQNQLRSVSMKLLDEAFVGDAFRDYSGDVAKIAHVVRSHFP